jgi:hypothetical protein
MAMTPAPYFVNKNILIISPESWSFLFVSKHHYAIELAKRNRVFFLGPPSGVNQCEATVYPQLSHLRYRGMMKGLRFLPPAWQRMLMRREYRKLERMAGVTFDCVWSFDNSVFFDFSFLPRHVLKISHLVDLAQNFNLARAASTADLCMGVSPNIVEKLTPYNRKTFLIPHGVHFNVPSALPVQLPGTNKIKAAYAGNLDSHLYDIPKITRLVEAFPEVDFILMGSGGKNWPHRANTFFLGVIPYEKLNDYLVQCDVLFIIGDTVRYKEQWTNSHKVLSYLASGRAIVSTWLADYGDKQHLINMETPTEDVIQVFRRVVSDLAYYNSEEQAKIRRTHAFGNSYAKRLEEIEALIQQVYNP